MPSQTIRTFGKQSRTFGRRTFGRPAVLLAVLLLLTATTPAFIRAAPPPQKDRQSDAREAFEEGERLRQQATPDSLRGAVEKYEVAQRLWRESEDWKFRRACIRRKSFLIKMIALI